MRRSIQQTCKGLRITIDPNPAIAVSEIEIIRNLLSSLIADRHTDRDVAQCLRYSRTHVLQAIRVLDKKMEAA